MQPQSVGSTPMPAVGTVVYQMRLHRLRWGVLSASDLTKNSKRFKQLLKLCDTDEDLDYLITYAADVRWVCQRQDFYDTPEIAWVFE